MTQTPKLDASREAFKTMVKDCQAKVDNGEMTQAEMNERIRTFHYNLD